jgi:DNA (cytosine-5)-methyltransferase 1
MAAYYNEFDSYAAQWLRNLIAAGHIAPGDVDERSIVEVQADDVRGFPQAHFFAGLGGWSYAARLAGLADDEPLWTGSCPCQPFSPAGKRQGMSDDRHLWPEWFRLIRAVRPVRVFGEQVEGAVRLGWLDAVFGDLEGEGYACGAAVLGAHSVGAPHIRQRLWFVADASRERRDGQPVRLFAGPKGPTSSEVIGHGATRLMADTDDAGSQVGSGPTDGRGTVWVEGSAVAQSGLHGHWSAAEWIACRDGKSRPAQPGIQPLAHGISARVGKLRAAGNAIVPQVAAAFMTAAMECRP